MDKIRPGAFFLLTTHFRDPIDQRITSFCRFTYDICLEWFRAVTHKKDKTEEIRPNRRQIPTGKLRSKQKMLRHRLRNAPIHERLELQNILNDIQKRNLLISRTENQRKLWNKKRQAEISFYTHLYSFAKIVIIMSRYQHGYSWASLATSPYRLLLSADPHDYIPYTHRAAVYRFELNVLPLLVHVKGSTGVYHSRVRPNFSSSVPRVWFI